ncbi:NhaP-type Na+/H+ and K+/H+ antiporter [Rubidibacter lacunae KORDI 51-2]|uniref:NhaP-type Na+/H+ and K+/H+ antiporter n=1 Tax=Rubidibacter lacunae KORDI 51-2 TaxID=582515 RepID=U5DNU6_9CHRO|nr:sodium:proton antiporter [Rubidibacter lacunae]ERN41380.1 NhaP-type Na+/H+ and K+/H+ antiporter [Rubidibacter lacunae KORDI 51-2]
MEHNPLLTIQIDILVLLAIACLAAVALNRFRFPYTAGLVVIGIALGWLARNVALFEVFGTLSLSHDLILFVFVPPLIFESALNLDSRLLIRNLVPILTLAAPGLLIATAITGTILSWGTPLTLLQAMLFGSLISATDPVAVIALFKELGAPKRLAVLVEGESLFNDATAIVTFNIILGIIAVGELSATTLQDGAIDFAISFVGGIVVGATFSYLARISFSWVEENPLVLATLSAVLAYGSFLLAEEVFHVSGVISVVSAGIVLGWYKTTSIQSEVREFLGEFWEYGAFLANSLIFLLVGLTVSKFELFFQLSQANFLFSSLGLTLVAILVARAIVVFGLTNLVNLFQPAPISLPYQMISFWGGLRGAVCLALALSLEAEFPNRDLIVLLTLGVAFFTIMIPGTTVGPLIRSFKLDRPSEVDLIRQAIASVSARQTAFEETRKAIAESAFVKADIATQFEQSYRQEIEQSEQSLLALRSQLPSESGPEITWLEALNLEQTVYRNLRDLGIISPAVFDYFLLRINLKRDSVLVGTTPPIAPLITPLERRWQQLWFAIGKRLAADSSWVAKLNSRLILDEYEYWVMRGYAAKEVSSRFSEFVVSIGIEGSNMANCLETYADTRKTALKAAESIAREHPELVANYQLQLASRVASLAERGAIEAFAKQGAISQAIAEQLLEQPS